MKNVQTINGDLFCKTLHREYAKNHPKPKCHAYEANDIAKIIENQSKREVEE